MHDIFIGKLKGRYVVYWFRVPSDRKTRVRKRLKAKTRDEARAEGQRVYEADRILCGQKYLFEDIAEIYVESLRGLASEYNARSTFKIVKPFFGKFDPTQINDDLVYEYLEERRTAFWEKRGKEISNGTLNGDIVFIQTALNKAYGKNLIEKPQKLKRPSKPVPRDRWLTTEEIEKLVDACKPEPHLQVALVVMLTTAGRIGSVLELEWKRVDFEARTIDLRVDPKRPAKGRAIVPMNNTAFEVLSRWKPMCDSKYVVEYRGGPIGTIRTSFDSAVTRAGLEDVTPHTIRHTAAVHMVAAGCSLFRVSQYLGHSSINVTEKVYARFAPGHLQEEADAVDFFGKRKDILEVIPLSRRRPKT
ncbi:site-specific integrase [Tropicimonas sp. TH_r6]|uniref:tyrosine-type recombinase/integrase n=1 Tax=Tropicimonas sp. TH_r6 TaxID=3082085 RepID=UPI002952AA1D|nr:site-specific integrase [Tropicimonas sp. TH_r6]MDV7145888.1 site-specific integrase [Tropicimonas sp. TH_r6]